LSVRHETVQEESDGKEAFESRLGLNLLFLTAPFYTLMLYEE